MEKQAEREDALAVAEIAASELRGYGFMVSDVEWTEEGGAMTVFTENGPVRLQASPA